MLNATHNSLMTRFKSLVKKFTAALLGVEVLFNVFFCGAERGGRLFERYSKEQTLTDNPRTNFRLLWGYCFFKALRLGLALYLKKRT